MTSRFCLHQAAAPAELDWAQRVFAAAGRHAGAVFSLDGRRVDAPVVLLAERMLARHACARGR